MLGATNLLLRNLLVQSIQIKKTKKINPRESPATKQAKTQWPRSKQNTASCKQRRIESDNSEAWHCFMCDDIVKENVIKRQVCLVLVWEMGGTFFEKS